MRDELYDRDYQAGRAELNAGLDRLIGLIADGLATAGAAIYRFEWASPWKTKDDRTGIA